jgi:hypothetical protein
LQAGNPAFRSLFQGSNLFWPQGLPYQSGEECLDLLMGKTERGGAQFNKLAGGA